MCGYCVCVCVWRIRFRSEHEIEKALRRAQQENNDWEAFVSTALERVKRKYGHLCEAECDLHLCAHECVLSGVERVSALCVIACVCARAGKHAWTCRRGSGR